MTIYTGIRPMTTTEFQEMAEDGYFSEEARLELIDGRIHEMSPVGRRHGAIVVRLMKLFPKWLGEHFTYSSQNSVQLLPDFQPQPDYMVLRYSDDEYESHLPTAEDVLLLIEVSDSTLVHDLTVKVPRYASAGVPEVWVIDVQNATITQFHTLGAEGIYEHQMPYQRGEMMATTLGVAVAVSDIVR